MNASDSERIAAFLEQRGFSPAENIREADLAVFNTCGIKQTAENRAYSMIHNLKKQDARNKMQTKIVMTGCLANRSDVQKRMQKSVDLFCEIKNFPEEIEKILKTKNQKLQTFTNKEQMNYLSINPNHSSKFSAYVPIMTGCDNFCAYCVVPYARGREVSRPAEKIIAEVEELVKKGYKHMTLLGQNVNSYESFLPCPPLPRGRGCHVPVTCEGGSAHDVRVAPGKTTNFSKLLKKIDKIPGKFWISFVSSHPKDFNDELIGTVAKCKKVCEWVHLPIQAGNDEVLKRMNRKYTQKHYLGIVRKIRSAFKKHKPDAPFALTSDIIVGFPGETRKRFSDSAKVMEKAKFDMVFFGQFSPRPGTAAWKMKDDVSQKEKVRREKFLNEILKETTFANNKKYVGKKMEVLIEKENDGSYFGKTRTMKNVKISSAKKDLVGKIVKAKITEANVWNLEGKM